ncbi:lipoate--protein ligase family protein [Stieleria varia]|uniref:Putative lipoate-protein ligase A n=1 Tax=Stieleria varia TaxID=2528005 RepID=A0A5C6AMV3_9BACT|nr:lipoate--protein ligase family protein [Stieleria varia]TWU00990.1 putative lipoate-protein ligase A [Stieleria varia]
MNSDDTADNTDMQRVEFHSHDPRDQLAVDEALLLEADAGERGESFRTWSFDQPVVVLGRSSRIADEVDLQYCQSMEIPVLRRCTGGASVVGGPGCMMYTVVLSVARHPELAKIDAAHRYVMQRVLSAVQAQVPAARQQGICDLTINDRKCSGNSLRVSRTHVLYHGTILHDADLELLARCLCHAPRQPEYRRERDHGDFVTNVALDPGRLAVDLAVRFGVDHSIGTVPLETALRLREDRYSNEKWHHRH